MRSFRELGKYALAGILGVSSLSGTSETPQTSTESESHTQPQNPQKPESPHERVNLPQKSLSQELNFEKPASEFIYNQNQLIDMLQEVFDGEITEGIPDQGMGYLVKKLKIGDNPETQSMDIYKDAKKFASVIIDDQSYTFKTGLGEREASVDTIEELQDVLNEYTDNFETFQQAFGVSDDPNKDIDEALQEAITAIEKINTHTTYFKNSNNSIL